MKIKHHPGIIEDPYPELALVIIKLNGAIISTGKKKKIIYGHKFIFLKWNSQLPFCSHSFWSHEAATVLLRHGLLLLSGLLHFPCLSPNTQSGLYQAQWSPWLKKKKKKIRKGYDGFSGLPHCCIIFIKVTLTVSTTQIKYFILPLTSPKFFLHFNRGDFCRRGVEHGATEWGLNTRRTSLRRNSLKSE